jgi:hypothetical protein
MGLPDLYPAQVGSPYTTLAVAYTSGEGTMTLVDATKLPTAPNIVCLAGDVAGEFSYTGKEGNVLQGVTALPGTPAATTWSAGTFAFRGVSAYDHNALIEYAQMDRPKRGAYDAMVYLEGTSVIAVDSIGNVIAKGTAGTDDATVIQAAIDVSGPTGRKIVICGGSYLINTTIHLRSWLLLEGQGNPTLSLRVDADLIDMPRTCWDVTIRYLRLAGGSRQYANGVGLHCIVASPLHIEDVVITDFAKHAIQIDSGWSIYIRGCSIARCGDVANGHAALHIAGNSSSPVTNVSITESVFEPNYFRDIYIGDYVHRIAIRDCWFESEDVGEGNIQPSDTHVFVDGNTSYNTDLITISGNMTWEPTGSTCKTFFIGYVFGPVVITGNRVNSLDCDVPSSGASYGIGLTSVTDAIVSNNYINLPGASGSESAILHCIGCSRLRIFGNALIGGEFYQISLNTCQQVTILSNYLPACDRYPIHAVGECDNLRILANDIVAGGWGTVGSQSTNQVAWGNTGYVTESKGTATLLNATTSIVVAHGCSATPENITVTPGSIGNATKWYVDTIGDTNFTIHVDQDPGADITFYWRAEV